MKKYLFIATALVALASCSENEFVGDQSPDGGQNEQGAIVFGSGANAITRASFTGDEAANLLNKKFIVGGFKGALGTSTVTGESPVAGVPTTGIVYDNYQVKWANNTANTTTSNTSGWEYVNLDFEAPSTLVNDAEVKQTIKYWDYSAEQYDFIAYSTSDATITTTLTTDADEAAAITRALANSLVHVTPINAATASTSAYKLSGDATRLQKCYIADMKTAYRSENHFQQEVEFTFRPLSAKVRIGLYETVPGYSVQNVIFYSDDDTQDNGGDKKAHLYTKNTDVFNTAGTYTVYFPTIGYDNKDVSTHTDYNKAHVSFNAAAGGTSKDKSFGAVTGDLTNGTLAIAEGKETTGNHYLGRSSNAATFAGTYGDKYYTVVLPNENGAVLNLKVDYTLLSTDGSGEVINVTGATAQVPAVYATWKSGYAYTYLFKISQNTNGLTNPSITDKAGLYPVTFDAVVVNDEVDNTQETITTVATPSITTYAKGRVVTANDEYTTGSNIYVMIEDGTALTVGTNANLYTVTLADGAAQTINEISVANAIKNGGPSSPFTVTDANGKNMTVTTAAGLTAVTEIAATDSPNGNAITVNGTKFTPSAAGIYAFEYINGTDKYYKIIKVIAAP